MLLAEMLKSQRKRSSLIATGHTRRKHHAPHDTMSVGVLSALATFAFIAGSGCAQDFDALFLDGGPGDTGAPVDTSSPADTGGTSGDGGCMSRGGNPGTLCADQTCCVGPQICSGSPSSCCTPNGGMFRGGGGGGGNPCCTGLVAQAGGTCASACVQVDAGCTVGQADSCCYGVGYCGGTAKCLPCLQSNAPCSTSSECVLGLQCNDGTCNTNN
jgi:hypothetical protein